MIQVGDFISYVLENNLEILQKEEQIEREFLQLKIQHLSNLNVLQISCVRNYLEMFKFLLQSYSPQNMQEQLQYLLTSIDDDNRSILFYSCLEGNEEMTLFILDFLIQHASQEQIHSHLLLTTKDAKYSLNREIFLYISGGRSILHALVERNTNIDFVTSVKQKLIQVNESIWNELIYKRDLDQHSPMELCMLHNQKYFEQLVPLLQVSNDSYRRKIIQQDWQKCKERLLQHRK